MTMPYYVSPEQVIADKAEFASKGIKRGRSVIVMSTKTGILFVADNPSRALHKIGEIYDRIGFAAVGKYNEFESLRVAGIRLADMRGYSYDRSDVTVRTIANAYAQTLGSIFIEAAKPYEVEIAVAEVGVDQESDQLYRISFDGSVHDESGYICMGGDSDKITEAIKAGFNQGFTEREALSLAVSALRDQPLTGDDSGGDDSSGDDSSGDDSSGDDSSGDDSVGDDSSGDDSSGAAMRLEVASLDRSRPRRTFMRFSNSQIAEMNQ